MSLRYSVLRINEIDLTDYQTRSIKMTLEPIQSVIRRTVNGEARNLLLSQFRKRKGTISCTDHEAPPLNGIWPGAQLTIECIDELGNFDTDSTDGTLTLPVLLENWNTERDEAEADTAWSISFVEV